MPPPRPHAPARPHSVAAAPRPSGRRRLATSLLAVAALVALVACEAPDPAPGSIVPENWGENLEPRDVDLLYLPGGSTGCPGRLTPNNDCGGSHTLDIYPATRGASTGTLLWLHGGGFVGGEKYPLLDLGPVKRLTHLGWSVVSANYRMADEPGNEFPTAAQDAAAALRWIRANGGAYGLDTRRIVVAGYSAGGTLATLMGTAGNADDPRFPGIPPISGWISFGGILDFDAGPLSRLWGSGWRLTPDEVSAASPYTWWDPEDPQGWIIHGDLDNTVEYSTTDRIMERSGLSGRIQRDTVDRFSDGTSMSALQRGHRLGVGMNSDALVDWLARLPTLETQANPVGSVDVVSNTAPGQVRVAGWMLDPDSTEPIDVHVYVDGRFATATSAQSSRPDVGRAYPLHGANHGFDVTIGGLRDGVRRVCVYAINAGQGTTNPLLTCRIVSVTAPEG
jgi:acetyl esterase/lipase